MDNRYRRSASCFVRRLRMQRSSDGAQVFFSERRDLTSTGPHAALNRARDVRPIKWRSDNHPNGVRSGIWLREHLYAVGPAKEPDMRFARLLVAILVVLSAHPARAFDPSGEDGHQGLVSE